MKKFLTIIGIAAMVMALAPFLFMGLLMFVAMWWQIVKAVLF